MIPNKDETIYGSNDYFIVDECDSMMLDNAREFMPNYNYLKEKVGGFFFLTATKYEAAKK